MKCIEECSQRMEDKKRELDKWIEKDETIMKDFFEMVPQNHSCWIDLKKIFLRKVKRTHNRNNQNNDSDNDSNDSDRESSSSDDSDEDEDSDSDDDEDDDWDDSCPENCDITLYNDVLKLREIRVEQEYILITFRKEIEELKRLNDRYMIREGQMNKELRANQLNIQRFHYDKQQKINELYTIIPLKASQMFVFDDENKDKDQSDQPNKDNDSDDDNKSFWKQQSISTDFDQMNAVIFPKKGFIKLRNRIKEIKEEIKRDKQIFKSLQKEKVILERKQLSQKEAIVKREEMCDELQHLRFGQLVDIDALDKMSISTTNDEEWNQKSENTFKEQQKQMDLLLEEKHNLEKELYHETQKNTEILKQIGQVSEKQFDLEKSIRERSQQQKQFGLQEQGELYSTTSRNDDTHKENVNYNDDKVELNELKKLRNMAEKQSMDLKALKDEILKLRKKEGKNKFTDQTKFLAFWLARFCKVLIHC